MCSYFVLRRNARGETARLGGGLWDSSGTMPRPTKAISTGITGTATLAKRPCSHYVRRSRSFDHLARPAAAGARPFRNDRQLRRRRTRQKRRQRSRPPRSPRHRDPRRARAQSQEHRPRHSARPARRLHRPFRLRQILARLRHHLRRGPAPLRREPLRLCAPVPGDDAEAGRRPDRRPLARHLHRAEDHLAQSALDRRHRHRDPRLHAASVGARRRALLAGDRPADREPDRLADGRPHSRSA